MIFSDVNYQKIAGKKILEGTAPNVRKCSTIPQSRNTLNLTATESFLFDISVTNLSVKCIFSLMTGAWTDQQNHCSVELCYLKRNSSRDQTWIQLKRIPH